MATTINFIRSLFNSTSAVQGNAGNLWTLYQMSRGRDSVSPAVLRKLAAHAAK